MLDTEADEDKNIPSLDRCVKFASLISHIAFLRTVPAPTFNSEIQLLLGNHVFNFKEEML